MYLVRIHTLALAFLFPLAACNMSVNESIHIGPSQIANGSQNTVNGSIIVAEKAQVRGDCRTVNGRIEIGSGAECNSLQTVNGEINLGQKVIVHGDMESVNGELSCESGVHIEGEINTVNGGIELDNTEVESRITTYNGRISLTNRSRIKGDIIIKENEGETHNSGVQKIEISGGSIVEGDIIVEEADKKVNVVLSSGGEVKGKIENAEVVRE